MESPFQQPDERWKLIPISPSLSLSPPQMQIESGLSAKWAGPPLDLSAVTICPRDTDYGWMQPSHFTQTQPQNSFKISKQTRLHRTGTDGLPMDPREWTRSDVWMWLKNLAQSEGLPVTELTEKFPMNGKALCLMSLDMYLSRPCGWQDALQGL